MANKAVFFDRDDTIIEDPGYINDPDQVRLLEGAAQSLIELANMDYKIVIASNQSGVARGIVSEKALKQIHERLRYLLLEKGAKVDAIYYCPYHVDGVIEKYRKQSDWRKPNPGMLLAAAKDMDIDLEQSWMIGNSNSDIEAGYRAGCRTILVNHPPQVQRSTEVCINPDYSAVNVTEAVNIIKQFHRTQQNHTKNPGEIFQINQQSQQVKAVKKTEAPKQSAKQLSNNDTAEPKHVNGIETEDAPIVDSPLQTRQADTLVEPEHRQTPKYTKNKAGTASQEELLKTIIDQLKSMQRADMFGEFSIMRLLAGIVQIAAVFCILLAGWFLINPNSDHQYHITCLAFAVVLQMMSLTFYIMQGRK